MKCQKTFAVATEPKGCQEKRGCVFVEGSESTPAFETRNRGPSIVFFTLYYSSPILDVKLTNPLGGAVDF